MDIQTEINKRIYAEDGKEVKPGMLCEFTVEDRSLCGIYQGITKRGALRFQNTVTTNVFYHVMPKVIGILRIAAENVDILPNTKVATPDK